MANRTGTTKSGSRSARGSGRGGSTKSGRSSSSAKTARGGSTKAGRSSSSAKTARGGSTKSGRSAGSSYDAGKPRKMTRAQKRRAKRTRKRNARIRKRQQRRAYIRSKRPFIILVLLIIAVCFVLRGCHNNMDTQAGSTSFDNSAFTKGSDGFKYYDDGTTASIVGIDVSSNNGEIDWEKVADSGVEFAFIRCGLRSYRDGKIYPDTRFKENIRGAKAAGLDVGVYFFSQAISPEEAKEDARYVRRVIRGRKVRYPIAFDMEIVSTDDRILSLTSEERTEVAEVFCNTVSKGGHEAMVYGNTHWLYNYVNLEHLDSKYSIWLANYNNYPKCDRKFAFWQYTSTGKIPGIRGNVDINLCFYRK